MIGEAIKMGACKGTEKADNLRKMATLFFTPQGIEFCLEHNYPSLEEFRKYNAEEYNVYVDKEVKFKNTDIALINSKAELEFSGVDKSYKVILMHGAEAEITVKNFAVIKIEKSKDSKVNVKNDGSAVVLW